MSILLGQNTILLKFSQFLGGDMRARQQIGVDRRNILLHRDEWA